MEGRHSHQNSLWDHIHKWLNDEQNLCLMNQSEFDTLKKKKINRFQSNICIRTPMMCFLV